jgi:CelD/BcsL family acetyltransferase involved in cellulose biosynthesis
MSTLVPAGLERLLPEPSGGDSLWAQAPGTRRDAALAGEFQIRAELNFDFGGSDYTALYAGSGASAFQHPLWLQALYATLAPARNAEPLIITARRSDDGTLVMVLPMLRRRARGLTTSGYADLGVSDYNVPVAAADDWDLLCGQPGAAEAILKACGHFDLLRIPKLRPDGLDLTNLLGARARTSPHVRAYSAALPRSFAQWREAQMNPSLRKELDKKRRRLDRNGGAEFQRLQDPSAITAALARLHVFRRPRFDVRDEQDMLDDPSVMAFYARAATAGAETGFARTYTLSIEGQLAAVTFGISHHGRFLVLLSAFDAAFSRLSLGNLLFEDVVRDCIESGDNVFDLTIGDEPYKASYGTAEMQLSVLSLTGSAVGWVAQTSLAIPALHRTVRRLRTVFASRSFAR